MARQIRRFGTVILLCISVVGVLIWFPLRYVQSDAPSDSGIAEPVAAAVQLGQRVRAAVGFGPSDYLAAIGTNGQYQELIAAGVDYMNASESDVAGLISAEQAAATQVAKALAWEQDADAALEQLVAAREALSAAASEVVPALLDCVDAEQSDAANVVSTNLDLDPDLRALDLTPEQRGAIVEAQWERDRVTKNPMNWYQPIPTYDAHALFEQTLETILTSEQRILLAAHRQLLEDRMVDIATLEMAALEGENPE